MFEKRFLVTGSKGYIGSHLVAYLKKIEPGCIVSEFDINSKTAAETQLRPTPSTFDCIFHLAAVSNVESCNASPFTAFWNNVDITKQIIDYSKIYSKGIVFASSSAVYASSDKKLTEDSKLRDFDLTSAYGASKIVCEQLLETAKQEHGTKYIALRLANVAGEVAPNTENHVPETHIIPRILKGDNFNFYGDPTEYVRCYVHVEDVCAAFYAAYKAMNVPYKKLRSAYNISGNPYKNIDLLDTRNFVIEQSITAPVREARTGDIKSIVMSDDNAQKDLHWKSNHDILSIMRSYHGIMGNNGSDG